MKCNAYIHACPVCSFNHLSGNFTELCRMLIVSCELIYDDAIRACAVSTVTADRTGKFVLLTYSLTASHCSTEAHLAGVPSPRSLDSLLAMRQSCSARLKSLVWCGCKKIHRFRVLIKAFLVKKKGTKLQFWKGWPKGWRSLDQWWPRLHLATPWLLHCPQEHAVKGTRPCCAALEKRKKARGARKSLFIFESQFCLLMILMDSQV